MGTDGMFGDVWIEDQPFTQGDSRLFCDSVKRGARRVLINGHFMIFSSMIGAGVVYLLTQPVTVPQAVVAGLGMTGILSSHAKDTGGQ